MHGDKDVVKVTDSSQILITRLSHLGDCVLTLPLASAIKAHAPNATIRWVIEKPGQQLLTGHPAVDELIAIPSGWLKRPRQVLSIRKQLRETTTDICIDPQSLSKSAILARLSAAPHRIGFAKPVGREIAPYWNNHCVQPETDHLVDRTLELLKPLGIAIPNRPEFALPHFEQPAARMDTFLTKHHLRCDFVVINPGAGWQSKRWVPRRFGTVARHLGQTHQLPSVVVWAGSDEEKMATEIVQRSGGYSIMAPKTDLQELTQLLRRAAFYLGGDTGPMHIAAAVGTACVALFGPTRPQHCGAYGDQHLHVQAFYQSTQRRTGTQAMQAIEVDPVIRACDAMVEQLTTKTDDEEESQAA